MPILETLFGARAAQPIEAVGRVIDDLFTSDEERLGKEALLTRLAQRPALAQIEVNRIEAQHRSVFVAGWRPFIGWICGAALAWNFVPARHRGLGLRGLGARHPGAAGAPARASADRAAEPPRPRGLAHLREVRRQGQVTGGGRAVPGPQ